MKRYGITTGTRRAGTSGYLNFKAAEPANRGCVQRTLRQLVKRASLLLVCATAPLVWAAQPVSINQADASGIAASLPGIGEVKAAAIVAERQRTGPFTQPADLLRVNGIGARLLQQIESYLLFDSHTDSAAGATLRSEIQPGEAQRVVNPLLSPEATQPQPKEGSGSQRESQRQSQASDDDSTRLHAHTGTAEVLNPGN